MSFTNDLSDGLIDHLVSAGIGVKLTSGAFASTDTAIVMQTLPQTPDKALAITIYAGTDDPTLSDSVVKVQVMGRTGGSDPRPTNDLMDLVFNALQNLSKTLSTGVVVQQATRISGIPNGKDENQRWVRSDNYQLKVWHPSTYRE